MKMIATLAAAFSLALAGAAIAADQPAGTTGGSTTTTASTPAPAASPVASPAKAATSTKPAAAKSVSGTFEKADSTANTVTLKVGGKEMTYNVSSDTKLTKGGKDITWADLKEGDKVSGKAEGDKLTMLSVKGGASGKTSTKPSASPAPSPAAGTTK